MSHDTVNWVIGYEIGGTTISVGAGNNLDGLIDESVVSEPVDYSDDEAFTAQVLRLRDQVIESVGGSLEDYAVQGIVAAGQLIDGAITNAANCSFPQTFPDQLGGKYVFLNDVAGGAYGAMLDGHGKDFDFKGGKEIHAAITIGTGTNLQIIVDGELLENHRGVSAELGHMGLKDRNTGAYCSCGSRGCAEAYFAGSGIASRAKSELNDRFNTWYHQDWEDTVRGEQILQKTIYRIADTTPEETPLDDLIQIYGVEGRTSDHSIPNLINLRLTAKDVFDAYVDSNGFDYVSGKIIDEGVDVLAQYLGNVLTAIELPYLEFFGSIPQNQPWFVDRAVDKLRSTPHYHGNRDPTKTEFVVTEVERIGLKGAIARALYEVNQ